MWDALNMQASHELHVGRVVGLFKQIEIGGIWDCLTLTVTDLVGISCNAKRRIQLRTL